MSDIGRIVWYELLSKDPSGSRAFYPEVFGWKTQPFERDPTYTMWVGNEGPLGGVSQLPEAAAKMGVPSFWQANVVVASVDESIEAVRSLGGTVHHSELVPGVGKLAVVGDPQGAVISLFTPHRDMPVHDVTRDGEFSWHELYTTDHEAAWSFYQQICGWERLGSFDMGPMGTYLLWGRQGKQLGGMMTMPSTMTTPDGQRVPPSWMYYATMADLDSALARAQSRGARIINGPMEVPGGQRIVQLIDPQGAPFAIVTPPQAAP